MDRKSRIEEACEDFDWETFPTALPLELKMLPRLDRELSAFYKRSDFFAGVDVLFVQHHLGPLIPKIEAMVRLGLDPDRCWFVDIPYSTIGEVVEWRDERYCPPGHAPAPFTDPLAPYAEVQAVRVALVMQDILNRRNPGRLLVLDDGAYFLRYLNSIKKDQPERLAAFARTCVVEQTTRGHRYVMTHKDELVPLCQLSLVSVAKCETKKEFESPFIGASIVRGLRKGLQDIGASGFDRIGVIGFGVVGKATVKSMKKSYSGAAIDVIEIDGRKLDGSDVLKGCNDLPELRNDKGYYDLIVGCTGETSFRLDQRACLADGAVLASGSSAAVEFNREGFLELADRDPDDEMEIVDREETRAKGINAPITIRREGGKSFTFLGAGFPINFRRSGKEIENVPPRIIQATHALMIAGACQALDSPPGYSGIDLHHDQWIFDEAMRSLERNEE